MPRRRDRARSSGVPHKRVRRRTQSRDRCRLSLSTSGSPAKCPFGFTSTLDFVPRRTHSECVRPALTGEPNTVGPSRQSGLSIGTRRILFRSRSPKSTPNDPFSSGSPVRWELIIRRSRREGRCSILLVPVIQTMHANPRLTSGVQLFISPRLAATSRAFQSPQEAAGLSRSALANNQRPCVARLGPPCTTTFGRDPTPR
jgi:hypothetical protein